MKVKFSSGDKVFAKVRGYPYWPARIVGPTDESAPLSKVKYEIIFYGTGEKAVVKADDVQSFTEKRHELGRPKKQKAFNDAMAEIESELSPEELAKTDVDTGSESVNESTPKGRKPSVGRPPRRSVPDTPETDPAKPSGSEVKPRGRKRKSVVEEDLSPESTSRSGRRIKTKRQSAESVAGPAETPRTVKRGQKYNMEDSLEFELDGDNISIPLNLNRPVLNCPKSSLDWQELVTAKATALRGSVVGGTLTLDDAVLEIDSYTKQIATEKRDEYRENDRQFRVLKVEGRLLQLDVKIKTCLTLAKANTADACKHMDELQSLPLTALMLKKHPEIIETFRRLTRYVGNTSVWNLSVEEKEGFGVEAQAVRTKAQQVLDKMTSLFEVPDGQCFYRVFSNQLRLFAKSTENLSQEQFFSLIREPDTD